MEPLKFSLKKQSLLVEIENERGQTVQYDLKEMTAADRDTHMDTLRDRMELDPTSGKPITMKKFEGLQAGLLTKCLFARDGGKPVPFEELQKWPAAVIQTLYDAAQKINKMASEKETEKEAAAEVKKE